MDFGPQLMGEDEGKCKTLYQKEQWGLCELQTEASPCHF